MGRTVSIKLLADTTQYISGVQRASAATKDFAGTLDRSAKAGKLDHIADQAARVGLVGVGAFGLVVKAAADFDKSMSAVAAATHAPQGEIDQLRKLAIQAGKDTQYSATEAADGVTELAKAGVKTADIMGGGLKGSLDLAAAGQLSVADAAEISASALTQFKLQGKDLPHVADLLAAGAGKAQGSVKDMSLALNQSGLVAAQFGLSIEDTTGVLAEFASAGLLGSDSGTSLKTMLLALANPTQQTRGKMQELGISFYDAQGRFVGLSGVAQVLQSRLKGLTEQQRNQALGQIFGNDAIRAASILYTDGAKGVETWAKKVNDAGYAQQTASKLTDNLAGDLERLKGSVETLAIESGSGANSGLRILTKGLGGLVNQLGAMPPAVGATVTVLAGVGGALLLGMAAWVKYRAAVARAQEQLAATGPAGEKAAAGLGRVTAMAGKIGVWSAALEAGSIALDQMANHDVNLDKLTESLKNLVLTGKVAGELKTDFGDNLKDLGKVATFADEASRGFGKFLNTTVAGIPVVGTAGAALGNFVSRLAFGTDAKQATEYMQSLDTAMTDFMNSTNDAKQANDLWARVLQSSGMDMDQLAALLPNAYKKVGELNTANMKAVDSTLALGAASGSTKGQIAGVGGAAKLTAAQLKQMKDSFDGLFKAYMTADQAEIRLQTAMSETNTVIGKGAHTLDVRKAAGQRNRTSILSEIDAINDLRTATVNQGGSLEAADKKYKTQIGTLGKHLTALGFDKTAVNDLIKKYQQIPDRVDTKVTVTGAPSVGHVLGELSIMQQALKKGGPLPIAARRAFNFADGGWTGPGSKYQPAGIVHADEYVVNKAARGNLEASKPGALDYMNSTGQWPGYDRGGHVTWPFPVNASGTKIPSKQQVIAAIGGGMAGGSTYAGGGNLGAWIMRAIALAGVPASWAGPLRTLVMRESGGNPRAINLWDSNAKAGHPSKGLAQTIGPTFEHYRLHSLPDDIYNPVANLVAAIRYIQSRYGTIFRVQQANAKLPPKGYAGGGLVGHTAMAHGGVITEPIFGVGQSGRTYSLGEGGRPETVIPGNWLGGGHGGGTVNNYVTVQAGYVVSEQDLENRITRTLDRLRGKGRA